MTLRLKNAEIIRLVPILLEACSGSGESKKDKWSGFWGTAKLRGSTIRQLLSLWGKFRIGSGGFRGWGWEADVDR